MSSHTSGVREAVRCHLQLFAWSIKTYR